jgi:hypothetical protein
MSYPMPNIHYTDLAHSAGDSLAALCGAIGSYASSDADIVNCVECVNLEDTTHRYRFTEADTVRLDTAIKGYYAIDGHKDDIAATTARRLARAAIGCNIHDLTAMENLYILTAVQAQADIVAGR